MGRHSAPDPDEGGASVEVSDAPGAPGAPGTPAAPDAAPPPVASGGRGDLQLLRADGGLRLRCAGAVVLTFLIFTSVLILLGRSDVYLIWLWIPIVVSGVVVGALLDHAHGARGDSR